MEAFSLLKFWKSSTAAGHVTPLPAAVSETTLSDEEASAGDDGPFFDLEIADDEDVAEVVCVDGDEVEVVEDSETETETETEPGSDVNSVFAGSLVRSATRLRILMSGFKKPSQPDPKQPQQRRKLFTIKFKPGEVPIVSLFTRSRPQNAVVSSLSASSSTSSSEQQQPAAPDASDEKRKPKETVQKYIKMVKPLYIRVSKKYGDKLGVAAEKKIQGSLGVGLKVMMMRKRLSGKMKCSTEPGVVYPAAPPGRQQDDLVQQHEWIQGAILHCKKSLNASQDDEWEEKTDGEVIQNDVVGG